MMSPYVYDQVQLIRVIDGDTVELRLAVKRELEVDFGFHVLQTVSLWTTVQLKFRLAGINTPEVVGESRAAGLQATAGLSEMLDGGPIRATTYKPDKYGRWLVKLEVLRPLTTQWLDVNAEMVARGLAVPYMVSPGG